MTASAKIAIPLTVLVPVLIALSAWQWNLQGRVTKTETSVDFIQDDLKEIKHILNRNYLMTRSVMDSVADDVQEIKTKVKHKR